jgi:Conserved TM helix
MLAVDIQQGLTDAWTRVATFVPKFLGFLVILLVGYFIAKALMKITEAFLERVGFDRIVERGSLKTALQRSRFDASDILATVVFWTVFLIALQLAFGVFGPNPVSDLLSGIIAYLPNVFVAIVIVVIASALAKVASELLEAMLGGVEGGRWMARVAGAAILIFGIFAALDQLQIAPAIVIGLYYAILAVIVGSAIVAVGVGGIPIVRGYLERASGRLQDKAGEVRREADPQAARERASELVQEERGRAGGASETTVDLTREEPHDELRR